MPDSRPDAAADAFCLAQPSNIRGQDCTRSEKDVWRVYCRYRNLRNLAWCKVPTVAKELGLSERTVQRAIVGLTRSGWLSIVDRVSGGQHQGTVYLLHPEVARKNPRRQKGSEAGDALSPVTGDKMPPQRVTKTTSTGDKNDGAIRKNIFKEHPKRQQGPLLSFNQHDEHFIEFYAEYVAETGVATNEIDQEKAAKQWSFLSLENRITAKAFIRQLIDGRPSHLYQRPQNYLCDRPWTRVSIRKEPTPVRGIESWELE